MLIQATLNWHIPAEPLNPCANVFHYKSFLSVTDELHAFADAWAAQVLPDLLNVCSSSGTFDSLICLDLADPAGEYDLLLPPGTVGAAGADYLPLWVTGSFEYRRKVRGERSGRKGFGPVAEADNSGGAPSAGYVTNANILAATLGAPLTVGLVETWFPVIGVRPVPPATAWTSHDIAGVLFKRFGSQNTRKR